MSLGSLDQKLNQYKPIDDSSFSSNDLSRSYWIVTHKVFFRNLLIGLLLVTDILLTVYAVGGFLSYLFVGQSREQASVVELARRVNSSSVEKLKVFAAQPMQYGTTQVFDTANGKFDFVVSVQNVNPEWYARVTYAFDVVDGPQTQTHTAYILPGEEKFLTALGEKRTEASVTDATLHIVDEQWTRISPHEIQNPTEYLKSRHTFEIFDPQFKIAAGAAGENTGNLISFDIANNSPFNYWAVPLQVVLLNAGQVQGVEEVVEREFRTGVRRTVTIHNFVKDMVVDEVRVIPSVDIFDPGVYMKQ